MSKRRRGYERNAAKHDLLPLRIHRQSSVHCLRQSRRSRLVLGLLLAGIGKAMGMKRFCKWCSGELTRNRKFFCCASCSKMFNRKFGRVR